MKAVIVEDEPQARDRLEDCLTRYASEYHLTIDVSYYPNAEEFLKNWRQDADVIFMDVDMPGMNGIEAARIMRQKDAEAVLIFVTNLAQYALEGYSVDALDFVLKPVDYFSFKLKIKKAVRAVQSRVDRMVIIQSEGQTHYLKAKEIRYVEVQNHTLLFHMEKEVITCTGALKTLEEQLPETEFYRCNYCYLVNLRHVFRVDAASVTVGEDTLQISRNRKKDFLEKLTGYYSKGGRFQ